jgi:hypothetical protein
MRNYTIKFYSDEKLEVQDDETYSCAEIHEFIKVDHSYLLCDLSSIIMNLLTFSNAIDRT